MTHIYVVALSVSYLGEPLRLGVLARRHDERAHVVLIPRLLVSIHERVHGRSAASRRRSATPAAPPSSSGRPCATPPTVAEPTGMLPAPIRLAPILRALSAAPVVDNTWWTEGITGASQV